jgi:hypothetical protein
VGRRLVRFMSGGFDVGHICFFPFPYPGPRPVESVVPSHRRTAVTIRRVD